MKRIRLEHVIAWVLLMILAMIVIHAPLIVFIGSRAPQFAVGIKAWKELLLLVALILLAVEYTRRNAWRSLIHDRLFQVAAGIAALHLATALFSRFAAKAIIAGLMIDLRYVAYFIAVYAFLRLYPAYKASFLKVGLLGACIVTGFAVLQLALPRDFLTYLGYSESTIQPYLTVDKNPAFVRENSTLRGPNPLGAYAMTVLVAVVAYGTAIGRAINDMKIKYLHLGLAVASLVSLWVSYSRSAWLGAAVGVATVLLVVYRKRLTKRMVFMGIGVALFMAIAGFAIRDSYFIKNVIVHDNPTTGAAVDSNAGHASSLLQGVKQVLIHPLGSGIGSTGSASHYTEQPIVIENQFLFVAHEVGWLGLALYIALIYLVLYRLWAKRADWMALAAFASGIGMIVIGLMLPVWVDDTVSMVWWGLAAVLLIEGVTVKGKRRGTATNKKAKRTA